MTRKIPPASRHYPSSTTASVLTLRETKEFTLYAYFDVPQVSSEELLIRLIRLSTRDDPENKTKFVLFHVAPEAVLLAGRPLYARSEFSEMQIKCEWSDFLRLTRWRKSVTDLEPKEQALIAQVVKTENPEFPYVLQAIDHPIRNRNPVTTLSSENA